MLSEVLLIVDVGIGEWGLRGSKVRVLQRPPTFLHFSQVRSVKPEVRSADAASPQQLLTSNFWLLTSDF